jgi:hypothetical protein
VRFKKNFPDSRGVKVFQPDSINVLFSVLKGKTMPVVFRILKTKKEIFMRKLIILLLAFAITACGAPPATPTEVPIEAVAQPTRLRWSSWKQLL